MTIFWAEKTAKRCLLVTVYSSLQESIYFEWMVFFQVKERLHITEMYLVNHSSRACKIANHVSHCAVLSHVTRLILGSVRRHASSFGAITRHAKLLCHPPNKGLFFLRKKATEIKVILVRQNLLKLNMQRQWKFEQWPLARSGQMICTEDASYTVQLSKQKKVGLDWNEFLGSPTV